MRSAQVEFCGREEPMTAYSQYVVVVSRSLRVDARAGGALWDFKGRQAAIELQQAQTSALLQPYCNERDSEGEGAEAAS